MADNLFSPSGNSSDPRPHQQGKAKGQKNGLPVTEDKEWMVDTGAQISVITKSNGDKFDLTAVGGSASGTTGGGGLLVKSGLTMQFEIFDTTGSTKTVNCKMLASNRTTRAARSSGWIRSPMSARSSNGTPRRAPDACASRDQPALWPLRGFGVTARGAVANRTENPGETHRYAAGAAVRRISAPGRRRRTWAPS
jgi:hypothetical protein